MWGQWGLQQWGKAQVEREVSNGATWSETISSLSSLEGLEQRSDKICLFF